MATATAASAADFPSYKDAPPASPSIKDVPPPAPMPLHQSWYLRGFIGMTNQDVGSFRPGDFNKDMTIVHAGFDSAPLYGLGLGYVHSPWLRFDVTGEYRGKSSFRGLEHFVDRGNICKANPNVLAVCPSEHTGSKSEWLFLANTYFDLGNWYGVTPYVGAGLGTANVKLHDFTSVGTPHESVWWASDDSQWNFAWALHGGLAYEVTPNVTVDLAYRYVDMGDGKTGAYDTYDPSKSALAPTKLNDITSHDVMLGVRWNFGQDSYDSYDMPPFK